MELNVNVKWNYNEFAWHPVQSVSRIGSRSLTTLTDMNN